MRLEDFEKKVFDDFFGLYSRGLIGSVPEKYFTDCLNLDFNISEWKTRDGLSTSTTLGYGGGNGKVRRFASFLDPVLGAILLILDEAGNLYTFSGRAGDSATTPRLTVGAATDFSAIKMLGKIFIAFHDGQLGLSGQNLKVYIPNAAIASDEFRDAAGLAPTAGSAMVAADGAAGKVNAGTYLISVSYITSSGFQTQPGPKIASVFTATSYVAPGSKKISLSAIPTGPAGTTKRQILITKANLKKYYFLASAFGGLISDNTTTTATLDFDDTTDLVSSADYLFNLLETIPAPLTLQDYNGKLVTGGENANNSIIRVSRAGDVESFDSINGIAFINKDDGASVRNLMNIRNVLYVWKNLGVYSARDNGGDASTWPVNPIDQFVNVGVHGIAEFFDMSGVRMARDWTLVATVSGIILFDGIVRKPPLTDYINDIWQTINYNQYHKICLVVDERLHKIYCAFPTGSNTDNDKLFIGDYNLCPGKVPEISNIKWSPWQFNPGGTLKGPTEIGIYGIGASEVIPTLHFGSVDGGGKIWRLDPAATTDDGTAINSFFETALLFWESGNIHFYTAARMRAVGSGTLTGTIFSYDDILSANIPSITLQSTNVAEILIRFNFQDEKARLKFNLSSGKFTLGKLEVYGGSVYTMRPA